MTTTYPPRASFLLDRGVARRWEEARLSQYFKAYWPQGTEQEQFDPLNHDDGSAGMPHPYCIYERFAVDVIGHSSGRVAEERIQYFYTPVDFTVHAKKAGNRDAKSVCEELVLRVLAAFDTGGPPLDISPDRHISTLLDGGGDVRRVGDQEWEGVISLRFHCEGSLNNCLGSHIQIEMPPGLVPDGDPGLMSPGSVLTGESGTGPDDPAVVRDI